MNTLQRAEIVAEHGRDGRIASTDGRFTIDFGIDPAGTGVSPEHLFAAAYAPCFHSALLAAAEQAGENAEGSTVSVAVSLEEADGDELKLGVEIRANIPGMTREAAEQLLHDAHQSCPYSKAVRGNLDVKLALV